MGQPTWHLTLHFFKCSAVHPPSGNSIRRTVHEEGHACKHVCLIVVLETFCPKTLMSKSVAVSFGVSFTTLTILLTVLTFKFCSCPLPSAFLILPYALKFLIIALIIKVLKLLCPFFTFVKVNFVRHYCCIHKLACVLPQLLGLKCKVRILFIF